MSLEACACYCILLMRLKIIGRFKIVCYRTKIPSITSLLHTLFYYIRGLQRSRTVFAMRRPPPSRLYADAISPACYEFRLDYVIIWRVHIWDNAEGKENSAVFEVSRLYLLSLSRLSTSNRPPCKWCVSGSHLIAGGLCAVDETQKVITIHTSN